MGADLLAGARQSVNIITKKKVAPTATSRQESGLETISSVSGKSTSKSKRTGTGGNKGRANKTTEGSKRIVTIDDSQSPSLKRSVAVNFLNSDKFSKDDRPPYLQDDEVFNLLSVEAAALQIMQWQQTKAMIAANTLKEKKSKRIAGREKPDETVKIVRVEAGEDDAMNNLHQQRFMMRTPLKDPQEYWDLFPKKWPEVNKSIFLDHLGLENICSPRTLELLHDRRNKLEIKMFLTINISVGRVAGSRKQNLTLKPFF